MPLYRNKWTNIAELFLSFFLTEVVANPDKQHTRFKAFFGWSTQHIKRLQFCVFNSSHSGIIQEGYHNFCRAIWIKQSQDNCMEHHQIFLWEKVIVQCVSYSKLMWIPHFNQKTWRVMLLYQPYCTKDCSKEKLPLALFIAEIQSQHTPPWHTGDNYGSHIFPNKAHNYTGSISLIIILLWHRVILFITQWRVIQGDRFNLIYPVCSWNPILIKRKVKKINK